MVVVDVPSLLAGLRAATDGAAAALRGQHLLVPLARDSVLSEPAIHALVWILSPILTHVLVAMRPAIPGLEL